MKEQMKRAMVFGLAVMLAAPAAQIVTQQDALAGPFDTLSGSRSGGKRTHKQKSKKDKKQADRKKSSSRKTTSSTSRTTRTTTTNRTTTNRSTPTHRSSSRTTATTRRRVDDRRTVRCTSSGRCDNEPRAVGSTTRRPVNTRTTTTRTTTTRRPVSRTTTHRRSTYRSGRPVSRTHHHHSSSSTTVHNHYYSNTNSSTNTRYYGRSTRSGGSVTTSAPPPHRGATTTRSSERELYLTGGMGLSGMSATQITDAPMPGLDFNLGVGAKRRLIVGELGFGLSGYRLDPEMAANTADMTLVSLTGDLKLQPKLAFIEPYVSAGLGGHVFNDHVIDEGAVGASLRLGAGVDLRFDTVAVSAQYQRNFLGLVGDDRIYEDGAMSANTETLGLGLKIYF